MTPQTAYKRPESVLVVIYARSGEVLMLRRCDVPDFWQSVTGSLQVGETPLEAARRELAEETGLMADSGLEDCGRQNRFPIRPPWLQRYAPGVTHNLEHVFRFAVPVPCAIQLSEHSAYRWLTREKAAALATSYTNRDAILDFVP